MTEWLRKWTPSILFNVGEFIIIIAIGIGLNVNIENVLLILLAFTLVRQCADQPMHYKAWQLCLVWSTAVFTSMYFVARADAILSVFMSALCALVVSGKFNYQDTFMWKAKGDSNYKILLDYIKFNGITDEVIDAEILLKQRVTPQEYMLYKRVLMDGGGKSSAWDSAEIEFDVHRQKIKEALDKCYCYMIGRLNI